VNGLSAAVLDSAENENQTSDLIASPMLYHYVNPQGAENSPSESLF